MVIFKKSMLVSILLATIVSLSLFVSCKEKDELLTNPNQEKQSTKWLVDISDSCNPLISYDSGLSFVPFTSIEEKLSTLSPSSCEDLDIQIIEHKTSSLAKTNGDIRQTIGDYQIRISKETHNLSSKCFSGKYPHVGIMLSKKNIKNPIFDIHFVYIKEGNRKCFGAYISGDWAPSDKNKRCFKVCLPDSKKGKDFYPAVQKEIGSMIVAAGVSATVAYLIAEFLTPVIIAAAI